MVQSNSSNLSFCCTKLSLMGTLNHVQGVCKIPQEEQASYKEILRINVFFVHATGARELFMCILRDDVCAHFLH